jgi:hypothetical protein
LLQRRGLLRLGLRHRGSLGLLLRRRAGWRFLAHAHGLEAYPIPALAELVMGELDPIPAVQLRIDLVEQEHGAGDHVRVANHFEPGGDVPFGNVLHPAFRHPLCGREIDGRRFVPSNGERRAASVISGSLTGIALGFSLAHDLALRLRIPAMDRNRTDLPRSGDREPEFSKTAVPSDRDVRASRWGIQHQLVSLDAKVFAFLTRKSAQKRRVGHVPLCDVLLGATGSVGAEPVLTRDLPDDVPSVDVIERPAPAAQRESMNGLVANDFQRGRQIAAELRLERDDLTVEDPLQVMPETEIDLHRRAGRELVPIDQCHSRIVEDENALTEEIDVQIDDDSRETRVAIERQLLAVQVDPAIRNNPMRNSSSRNALSHPPPSLGGEPRLLLNDAALGGSDGRSDLGRRPTPIRHGRFGRAYKAATLIGI